MTEIDLTLNITLLLLLAGAIAGFVDALAGGGGLISLPALLMTGLPPINAIATNKLQGSFGTLTSSLTVLKKNIVSLAEIKFMFFASLLGSSLGAFILLFIDVDALQFIIPLVLISIIIYFSFSPNLDKQKARTPKISRNHFRYLAVPFIGFYDGILGTGAGSFFATAGVALRAQTLVKATSVAKFLNLASNFAALVVFIFSGKVIWIFGSIMIIGQILGGYLGSLAIVNGGTKFIKPMILIMSSAMTLRYVYEMWY